MFFAILSCGVGYEAQHATPLQSFPKLNEELKFPCNP